MRNASLFATVCLGAMALAGGARAADPLAAYQWHKRVLLVTAPSAGDARLAAQRTIYVAMQEGAKDRDLMLVEAVGRTPKAEALRRKFGLDEAGFRALLIGKDGGEKLSSATPLGPDQLFPLIDAMPMRQDEMHPAEMRRRR